ncbi:hypothetical protein BS50DRAFT_616082 [Corynespora cassiicola Philippines]|uniref:Uncharacterized protein n=1 Tax=Corynespora cassiicola Philippines TaxID=1448308 RepID=A0A2T2PDK1_CORCC|nr:hypothetical protein BS50DRAFT_616082 [Corynespora cassiicola Philippines]
MAQPTSSDEMDLFGDSELPLPNDSDIDIGDTPNNDDTNDEDLELADADLDAQLDAKPDADGSARGASANDGDLIMAEQDNVYAHLSDLEDAGQATAHETLSPNVDVEEDLIDYSDDDEPVVAPSGIDTVTQTAPDVSVETNTSFNEVVKAPQQEYPVDTSQEVEVQDQQESTWDEGDGTENHDHQDVQYDFHDYNEYDFKQENHADTSFEGAEPLVPETVQDAVHSEVDAVQDDTEYNGNIEFDGHAEPGHTEPGQTVPDGHTAELENHTAQNAAETDFTEADVGDADVAEAEADGHSPEGITEPEGDVAQDESVIEGEAAQATAEDEDGDESYDAEDERPAEVPDTVELATQRAREYPITLCYEGEEYWLFKQADSQDTWLLDDESILVEDFPQFFRACRAALGDRVKDVMKLGLCFHHFADMEVFEDEIGGVLASVAELHRCYIELSGQDGYDRPQSFYITLLVRPRFSALLTDLRAARSKSMGFRGFHEQISAGKSSFSYLPSQSSPEFEDEEQGQWEGTEPHGEESANEQHYESGEEQAADQQDGAAQYNGEDDEAEDAGSEHAGSQTQDQDAADTAQTPPSNPTNESSPDEDDASDAEDDIQNASPSAVDHAGKTSANEEENVDFLDYSDSDDDEQAAVDVDPVEKDSSSHPSSSSSTVQGDQSLGLANVDENPTNLETAKHPDAHEPASQTYEENHSALLNQDDYQEEYSQDTTALDIYDNEEGHDPDANYNIAGTEGETFDEFDFASYADDQGADVNGNSALDNTDYMGLHGFSADVEESHETSNVSGPTGDELGLDNGDEFDFGADEAWALQGQEVLSEAADSFADASNGLAEQGPAQGTKRTIEQVGGESDGAADTSGKQPCYRLGKAGANVMRADPKRTRLTPPDS